MFDDERNEEHRNSNITNANNYTLTEQQFGDVCERLHFLFIYLHLNFL